jgi:hypothetical protein
MFRKFAAFALVLAPAFVFAEEVEFVINPQSSSILAFGTLDASEANPQLPGSDTASYSGRFRVNLTDSTIQFLDGSFANALPFPMPLEPGLDGGPGSAPGNYGFETAPGTLGPTSAALRDFVFNFISDPLPLRANGPLLQFNTSVQQGIETGVVDFHNGTVPGFKNFAGFEIGGDDDNVSSLSTDGSVQTLRFHFYSAIGFDAREDFDSHFQFAGELVATRVVPEPAGLVFAALSCLWLLRRRG